MSQRFDNDFYAVEKDANGLMKFTPKFTVEVDDEKGVLLFETEKKTMIVDKYAQSDKGKEVFTGGYYIPQDTEFRRRAAGDWAYDPLKGNRPIHLY